jgi:hypothetical protein
MSKREGWNVHGHWVGDADNEPTTGQPPRARCGGPNMCKTCTRTPTQFPQFGEHPHTKCKYCGEPIVWAETQPNPRARTEAGKREVKLVPMDAEPSALACFTLTKDPAGGRPLFGEMGRNQAAGYRASGGKTYQRHVKTCARVSLWPKGAFIAKQRGTT